MDPRFDPERFWRRLREMLDAVPAEERRPPRSARGGAVLVLLEETSQGPRVILTRRRHDLHSHPGQVSFPGGRIDPGETVEQAAVREAHEEIALDASSVEIVGTGPRFYIPPSRFWVVPVLARWRDPHPLSENPWEVDRILRVPLAELCDPRRQRRVDRVARDIAWAWQLDDDLLWGATARVLTVLLDVAVEDWSQGRSPADLDDTLVVRPTQGAARWTRRVILRGELPAMPQDDVPHVTGAQTRSVRGWLDVRGVNVVSRGEHAGRALTHAARRVSDGSLDDVAVTVIAGPSSNGVGGLAAARLLSAAGARVSVLTVGPPRAPEQTHVLRDAGISVETVESRRGLDDHEPGDVVIDAMLGIGADPPLRAGPGDVASWLQAYDVRIVSLDLPSGISADRGLRGTAISADVTIATGLPVMAVREAMAQPYVGDLYLADVGVPPAAWHSVDVDAPKDLFAQGPLVRLEASAADDASPTDPGV